MMTNQRIIRLRTKIQESRSRLLSSFPAFSMLSMYLRYIAVPDMKKISVNAENVFFSPTFLDKLYPNELDFVLCHQIMHIVLEHIWQPFDRIDDDFHLAYDIIVNALLDKMGFERDSYPHLGNIIKNVPQNIPDVEELSPDEIMTKFSHSLYLFDKRMRSNFFTDETTFWDKEGLPANSTIIIDLPEMVGGNQSIDNQNGGNDGGDGSGKGGNGSNDADTESNAEALKSSWKCRVGAAISSTQSADSNDGVGNVAAFMQRIISKNNNKKINWKRLLHEFLQETISDYSFSPPDRRFSDTDFFLPDLNEKEFYTKDILFMVDTSSSVTDITLSIIYSEIRSAIEQFNGALVGKLGFFDSAVTEPLPFETINDLMKIIPYGGGGTNFCAIFDYLKNNYSTNLPACMVIFTDGQAGFPPEAAALGVPVLWLIYDPVISAPWGKTVRLLHEFLPDDFINL
ncbi:MAG: hypothetical protein IIW73_05530 [Clostridia bacterium]|nr:hypothetical protein [Clostridia bacterium]